MFIFGGGTFEATNFNDLWRFDLSSRKFVRPLSTGSYPPPKSCATFLSHRDKLLLFGGWRYNSTSWPQRECALYNQLHVYDVPNNKWTLISGGQSDQIDESADGPPTLARHSATIMNDEMIVFGGIQNYSINMTYSNDIWRLDLNTYKWQKQKVAADSPQPSPRYGQAQVQLNEHNILIMGGCGGPNNIFKDAWLLTRPPTVTHNKPWTWKQIPVKTALKSSPSPTVHVWCNPACAVGDNLLVLGPTRANDFQMVKETSNQTLQQQANQQQRAAADVNRPPSPPAPFRRAAPVVVIVQVPLPGEHHQMVREFNNRAEWERQRLDLEHENIMMRMRRFRRRNGEAAGNVIAGGLAGGNAVNMVWGRRPGMRLAAFQDEPNNNNNQQERVLPRLQEAHQILMRGALRGLNEGAAVARQGNDDWNGVLRPPAVVVPRLPVEVSKARVNRSKLMALHVCDLSKALLDGDEAVITWKEPPANLGCFPGAPEKLILYSLVLGKGELIMFGGLVKEINSVVDEVSKVSNGLHFLSVPKRII